MKKSGGLYVRRQMTIIYILREKNWSVLFLDRILMRQIRLNY